MIEILTISSKRPQEIVEIMTLLADRHQLVARLCLVTQCLAVSAYGFAIRPMANLTLSRGRASKTVHSKAEPWNEVVARWRSARWVLFSCY